MFTISFPSLICNILIKKKPYIMTSEDIICVPLNPLKFSYKFFTRKHVQHIVLSNLPNFNEFGLSMGDDVPQVLPMSGPIRGHILTILMYDSKVL